MAPREECGVTVPDVRGYNLACLSRHFIDWLHITSHFSSFQMEADLSFPWDITALLHTSPCENYPPNIKKSILLKDTIMLWKLVREKFNVSFQVSKYLLLWNNPSFPQGMSNKLFEEWSKMELHTIG